MGSKKLMVIRRDEELAKMREAGRITAMALDAVGAAIRPGVTALDLDKIAETTIRAEGAEPAFVGYRGYQHSTCISINDQIVHGIPTTRRIKDGDMVGVDVGARVDGYHGDSAKTYLVGTGNPLKKRLMAAAQTALMKGISKARAGAHIGDISSAIQAIIEAEGFSVVRDLYGHGIGKVLHEDPLVPNFGRPGTGDVLVEGQTIAIEPMVNEGGADIRLMPDGWTIVTQDGKLSAHFEHTIRITQGEPEILTQVGV